MMARYDRYLSDEFLQLLHGPLEFLVKEASSIDHDPYAVDVQLREGDVVQFYHGTTSLLRIENARPDQHELIALAADSYGTAENSREAYQRLIRRWNVDSETANLQKAILDYFPAAIRAAGAGYYRNEREGFWQNRVCIDMGMKWDRSQPWAVIDREAVIGFDTANDKADFYRGMQEKYVAVRRQLASQHNWAQPTKDFGDELDVLAMDPKGHLLCIEMKHGGNTAGIYYGTLQAAVYRDAFTRVVSEITAALKTLLQQKIQLGLLPGDVSELIPEGGFGQVGGALLIAEPNPASECWKRLAIVMEACEDARMPVLAMSSKENGTIKPVHEIVEGIPEIIRQATLDAFV